ncbi:uncharacterized protein [Scyliorhinus torazame]|uniref:uncharacterized protein isoform X4 n=1 Tax=Scyliorhinus torazame TaxID=75743 RepID=UPI003B597CB9
MFFQEIFAIYGNVYFFVGYVQYVDSYSSGLGRLEKRKALRLCYVQYVDSYSSGLGRLEKRKALRLYSPLLDYIRIAKSQQDHFQDEYHHPFHGRKFLFASNQNNVQNAAIYASPDYNRRKYPLVY